MTMRGARWIFLLGLTPFLPASTPPPAAWVPIRWPWTDPQSLDLLAGGPVNCLLLKAFPAPLVQEAQARGLVTLGLISPDADPVAATSAAVAAHLTGVVLEGDFPEAAVAAVRRAAGNAPVIELTARSRMRLGSDAPIIGTWQGVWPGISAQENGSHRAGPTGSAWIDTNTGFIRAARAWGDAALWIANQPPPHTVITSGALLPGDRRCRHLRRPLGGGVRRRFRRPPGTPRSRRAGATGSACATCSRYFERHPEWRAMREYGKLALVQDPAKGGLVSGGILDMIAVKHTPVRARPAPAPHPRIARRRHHGGQRGCRFAHPASRRKCCATSRAPAARCSPARRAGRTSARRATASRSTRPSWIASTTSGATSIP